MICPDLEDLQRDDFDATDRASTGTEIDEVRKSKWSKPKGSEQIDLWRRNWHCRAVAGQGGAAHVARFCEVEWAGAMHGLPIVPDHQVADLPFMGIDELALRCVFDQVL